MKKSLILGIILFLIVAVSFNTVYAETDNITDTEKTIADLKDKLEVDDESLNDVTDVTANGDDTLESDEQDESNNQTDGTQDDNNQTNLEEEMTDFSNAKIEVVKENVSNYNINITNINLNKNHFYRYFIGGENDEPEVISENTTSNNNTSMSILKISKYLELGPDQYLSIYEYYINSNGQTEGKWVLNKVKIEKPESKYTDLFYSTIINKLDANGNCQILFTVPWAEGTTRKVTIKVGRISDNNILKDIKDGKNGSFANLLTYAKSANSIYSGTLDGTRPDSSFVAGGIITDDVLFTKSQLTNNAYYYLYAVLEDENGKYQKSEGITLAQASTSNLNDDYYSLFFYGSDNFNWENFDEGEPVDTGKKEEDNTVAPGKIPQTGVSLGIILSLVIVSVLSIIFYNKYRKYNF